MSDPSPEPRYSPTLAPPTQPGPIVPVEPARWPNVLGIVSIVFGALGALQGCSGVASAVIMPIFMRGMPAEARAPVDATAAWGPWLIALGASQALVAIGLLVAGILVLTRKPGGARLLAVWGVVRMIVVVFGAVVTFRMQRDMMASMAQSGRLPAFFPGLASLMGAFGVVFTLAWGFALPVFVLIWLRLRSVRAEIARWGDAGRASA